MTEHVDSGLITGYKMRADAALSRIEEGQEFMRELDEQLKPLFQRFFEFGSRMRQQHNFRGFGQFACHWTDYKLQEDQPYGESGFFFSHDCIDHGYDLHDYEWCVLPFEYLDDPDAFERKYSDDLERRAAEKKQQKADKEIAELKRLAALHPDVLKETK